jgi:uncharacterized RDD family membrane protein YckC
MTTQSTSELDMNHWLFRFLAFVIDSIIIGIPAYIIYFIVQGMLWPSYSFYGYYVSYAPWYGSLLLFLILGVLQVLYFAFMESSSGATLGKKILGFKVQMVDGSKLTFNQALIRNISKIYGLFLLLDWIIGIATPGSDRRQKYFDRMAKTTVVGGKTSFSSTPPPPPPPPT